MWPLLSAQPSQFDTLIGRMTALATHASIDLIETLVDEADLGSGSGDDNDDGCPRDNDAGPASAGGAAKPKGRRLCLDLAVRHLDRKRARICVKSRPVLRIP